jgi:acyl-CoA thioesterase
MDARQFLGLEATHNPHRWVLPIEPRVCTGGNFLFGGCGLGAAIAALEGTTERPVVWAAAQYLSYARPPEVMDIDVTIAVGGNNTTQARAVAHVVDREILTVSAATLAILGDYVPFGVGQALGQMAGGNSLDNTLRVSRLVPTEWVLLDIQVHAIQHGFGHGLVHLWAEDGTLLAIASQSCIVRYWREEHRAAFLAAKED